MDLLKTLLKTLMLFLLLTSIYSCASERYLNRGRAGYEELAGTYTLLLYGARHMDDLETAAIFDKEGDPYTIEIYAPEFDYIVRKGMTAKDALAEAQAFVKYHRDFARSRFSKLTDNAGNIVGYEMRPLYHAFHIGESDVLYIDYMMKDNKVITNIRLKDNVKERDRDLEGPTR